MTRVLAITAIAFFANMGFPAQSQAKSLRDANIPAEFPPASYKGKQYVDSRGCVYIRAGIDGITNWVPRVSRSREVLCGYKPSLANAAPTANASRAANAKVIVPAATPKPATAAKVATTAKTAKVRPVPVPKKIAIATPKPVARTVAKPAPANVVRRAVPAAAPVVKKPVVKPTVQTASVAATNSKTKRVTRPAKVTSCTGYTSISRYYAGRGTDVRCGPQSQPYVTTVGRKNVTVIRNGAPVTVRKRVVTPVIIQAPANTTVVVKTRGPVIVRSLDGLPGNTRVVPRHVWENQQTSKPSAAPLPKGYRPAWDDDRLNPKRAHQTVDGIRRTDLAWTRTVPRKLYKRSTGRVVTQYYPGLKFPYYSYDEMRAAGYSIATKDPVIPPAKKTARLVRQQHTVVKPAMVSTKAVARPAPKAAATGRYVQVGTFGNPANAQRTAARLQSMGLPVRYGTLTKGSKSYRIVLAGPFRRADLGAALNTARRAGFSDAFVR
ncbi:SPOR domain-containing protein [Aquicoccus sp. G2-2]|uniref:SPOR domain-containing protein n=1 Tax=Aquicoccus sp. G2-2 TaxID=3092120 RepID=UPI002AE0AC4A|nr:SPOR domain-containing protein [Aquicoccus sp. G2-2]MEA1113956.1 SPOR domain-containing protein [Aquicoccus sp. G2-2]